MYGQIEIQNPKPNNCVSGNRPSWYPYYAGFSYSFAYRLIASIRLAPNSVIVDPWNGSGTTTEAASSLGYSVFGFDLNPVMAIVAKARTLNNKEKHRLYSIAEKIIENSSLTNHRTQAFKNDPLTAWFTPLSASYLRSIENSIRLFVSTSENIRLTNHSDVNRLSSIAAFFYLALFRTTRKMLARFFTTNPTWIKKPLANRFRLRTNLTYLINTFAEEISIMLNATGEQDMHTAKDKTRPIIKIASSDMLPLKDKSVNMILTSPPYCTRIDYAVATMPELALLGYLNNESFSKLRSQLIGSSMIAANIPAPLPDWGPTCNIFLKILAQHKSKSSGSYYLKNHLQYFGAIFRSLGELYRTLAHNGICIIVAQDSFYKEIHNDLPKVFIEMGTSYGFKLGRREDFRIMHTMAGINPRVRRYRKDAGALESVLCFSKK